MTPAPQISTRMLSSSRRSVMASPNRKDSRAAADSGVWHTDRDRGGGDPHVDPLGFPADAAVDLVGQRLADFDRDAPRPGGAHERRLVRPAHADLTECARPLDRTVGGADAD